MSYPIKTPGNRELIYEKDRAHRMAKKLGLHIVSRASSHSTQEEPAKPMAETSFVQENQRKRRNGPRLISTSSLSKTEEGAS